MTAVEGAIAFVTLATKFVQGCEDKSVYCSDCRNKVWKGDTWTQNTPEQATWIQNEVLRPLSVGFMSKCISDEELPLELTPRRRRAHENLTELQMTTMHANAWKHADRLRLSPCGELATYADLGEDLWHQSPPEDHLPDMKYDREQLKKMHRAYAEWWRRRAEGSLPSPRPPSLAVRTELYDNGDSAAATDPSVRVTIQTGIFPKSMLLTKLLAVMKNFRGNHSTSDAIRDQTNFADILHKLLGINGARRKDYVVDHLDRQKPLLIQRKLQFKPRKTNGERDLAQTPMQGTGTFFSQDRLFLPTVVNVRLTHDDKINVHITYSLFKDIPAFALYHHNKQTRDDAIKEKPLPDKFANTIQLNVHSDGFLEAKPDEAGKVLPLWKYLPLTHKYLKSSEATALVLMPRNKTLVEKFMNRGDAKIRIIGMNLSRSTLIAGVQHVACGEMTDAVTFASAPYRLVLAVLMSFKKTEGFQRPVQTLRELCDAAKADSVKMVRWSAIIASTNCKCVPNQPALAISVDALQALYEGKKPADGVPLSYIWENLTNYVHQEDTELPYDIIPGVVIRYVWSRLCPTELRRTGFLWREERQEPPRDVQETEPVAYVYLGAGGYSAIIEAEMKPRWDLGLSDMTHFDTGSVATGLVNVYTPLSKTFVAAQTLQFTRSPYVDENSDIPYQLEPAGAFVHMSERLFKRLRVKSLNSAFPPANRINVKPSDLVPPTASREVLELNDAAQADLLRTASSQASSMTAS